MLDRSVCYLFHIERVGKTEKFLWCANVTLSDALIIFHLHDGNLGYNLVSQIDR